MCHEEMTVEVQLRMFALEKALNHRFSSHEKDVAKAAKEYLKFLKGEE